MELPLQGAIALVTGASRGIGAAAAIELARLGAQCVITARTEAGLIETDDAIRALDRPAATLLPLDLADGTAVDRLGPSLHERFGRLDILVSCAGALGKLTPAPHILESDWNEVVAVNLAAPWRLIRTLAPLLLAAPAGRAVFVTAGQAQAPQAYWGGYGASLAGAANLALSWAEETRRTRLRVNLFDPGIVATRLRAAAMPGLDPATLAKPKDIAAALAALCLPAETRHAEIVRP